ncbi:MAG: hypothetical protein J5662_01670 [Clostridia bacterium]|nr:hypothetical protein [Clostridia bacterium]
MKYKRIIREIAKKHNVSEKEVDSQIRFALKSSGINLSPEIVIKIATQKIKKDYLS